MLIGNEKLAVSVIANGSDVPSIEIHHDSRLALDLFKKGRQKLLLKQEQKEGNQHGDEDW